MKLSKFTLVLSLVLPGTAFAQSTSHSYVNTMRSSEVTHLFFSESVEGEVADVQETGDYSATQPGTPAATTGLIRKKWSGYNLNSTLGLEIMKFIQFHVSYASLNLHSNGDNLEKLGGSRVMAGSRFIFIAPLANLEAGGGVIGTRYDYQHQLETASFYGSGYYYSLGMNYFMSQQISLFGTAKMLYEHDVNNGGGSSTKGLDVQSTNLGMGFTLWL